MGEIHQCLTIGEIAILLTGSFARGSSFDRAEHDSLNEEALPNDEQDHERDHAHHTRGHDEVSLTTVNAVELKHADR